MWLFLQFPLFRTFLFSFQQAEIGRIATWQQWGASVCVYNRFMNSEWCIAFFWLIGKHDWDLYWEDPQQNEVLIKVKNNVSDQVSTFGENLNQRKCFFVRWSKNSFLIVLNILIFYIIFWGVTCLATMLVASGELLE